MVNDDKPLLPVCQDGVSVHGTQWNGKHHLENNITEEEIVGTMLARYNIFRDILEKDVSRILKQLRSIGALDE